MIEIQSRPLNCDRGGRLSREKLFRLLELSRVLDGDMGVVRLRDGRVQLIESDLIKDPDATEMARSKEGDKWEWVDGIQVDYAGFPRQYSVHRRKASSTEFSERFGLLTSCSTVFSIAAHRIKSGESLYRIGAESFP